MLACAAHWFAIRGGPGVAEFTTIGYRVDDGVAWVTLNRPDVLNAFSTAMLEELRSVWVDLRTDDSVRCVVLAAAGDRAFCTGVDRGEALGDAADGKMFGAVGGPC